MFSSKELVDDMSAADLEIFIPVWASGVKDNRHLKKVLKDADPSMRRQVYDELLPHLKFKPRSYLSLNR